MHDEEPKPGSRNMARRAARHWGRTVRRWTPVIGTAVTTAAAIYQAWHGQPPG